MKASPESQYDIPPWLRVFLDEEIPESEQGKRSEARADASGLAKVTHISDCAITPVPVRLFNAGPHGIGFTARREFNRSDKLTLVPHDAPEILAPELAVRLQVMHCTQTVQGFKIGCKISQ